MSENGRGLDHLMEQNDTELDFLSAYGDAGGSSTVNGASILEALTRFLRAGGCTVVEVDAGIDFDWGTAVSTMKDAVCTCAANTFPWWPVT